jgi:hypothetical protein
MLASGSHFGASGLECLTRQELPAAALLYQTCSTPILVVALFPPVRWTPSWRTIASLPATTVMGSLDRFLVDDDSTNWALVESSRWKAIAELIGDQLIQPGTIGIENRISQGLDRLENRRLVVGLGEQAGAPQQARTSL